MLLSDWLNATGNRISEGSEFLWACYPDSYILDYWQGPQENSVSVTYNRITQEVYEASAHDYANNRYYRWFNPEYRDAYCDEAKKRDIDPDEVFDDEQYITLEVEEDILEKSSAIANNRKYDDRVLIPLTLDDETLLVLFKLAHEQDKTFNQFVVDILTTRLMELELRKEPSSDDQEFS